MGVRSMKLGEVEWKQACKGGCNFLEGILERLSERAACGKETEGGQGVSSVDVWGRTTQIANAPGRDVLGMCEPGE